MLRRLPFSDVALICERLGARTIRGVSPLDELDVEGGPVTCAFGLVDGSAGLWIVADGAAWAVALVDLPAAAAAARAGLAGLGVAPAVTVTDWSVPLVADGGVGNRLIADGLSEAGTGLTGTAAGSPLRADVQTGWAPTTFIPVPSRGQWWISWWDEWKGLDFCFGLLVLADHHPMETVLIDGGGGVEPR